MSFADDLIAKARAAAEAREDPSKHAFKAPPGYRLRGVSTLLDGEGKVAQQWVKTAPDNDPVAILDAFTMAVAERDIPAASRIKAPKSSVLRDDLLAVYPMGDPHIGMLSWAAETGADFDLRIAERNLFDAVDRLVASAPRAKQALIVDAGDFFHADNPSNRTARSGHALDVDSRWAKVLRLGVSLMCRCIDRALQKHEIVNVIIEIGNHDDCSSVMLAICLDHHYRDNPRVAIDTSPAKYHWYEFGANLIGTTHGDTAKARDLPGIMAADMPQQWGRTKFRHFYVGHIHHVQVHEFPGCTVEYLRTLAARDNWHSAQGYRSGRSMFCDVWHREHGPITRNTVGVEMLEAAQ